MTDPGELLDAAVLSIQTISALVQEEFDGDEGAIFAYRDAYPTQSSLVTAIENAPRPSIMLAYMGMVDGHLVGSQISSNEVDHHKFSGYVKAKDGAPTDYGYFRIFKKLIDGLTGTSGETFRYATIHENCYPPEKINTKRIVHTVDLWEISFVLTEIGG